MRIQLTHSQRFAILIIATIIGAWMDIRWGSVHIPLDSFLNILMGEDTEPLAWKQILFRIRLPRAITALLAGSALASAGLHMQTLFRNPLVGPSTLGIAAGASLGVAWLSLRRDLGWGSGMIRQLGIGASWELILAASIGALVIMIIILLVSLRIRDEATLLIIGLMTAYTTSAIISLWQYISRPEDIQSFLLWTFGSLGGASGSQLWIMAIVIGIGWVLSVLVLKPLDMLLLGETYAQSLGLNVMLARWGIILAGSLLTGAVTAFCGPIAFVGIAVPHLARSWFHSSKHYILFPATILMGALIMLLCDLIAQWPGNAQTFPINAITSLLGAPVVIIVLLRQRKLGGFFS